MRSYISQIHLLVDFPEPLEFGMQRCKDEIIEHTITCEHNQHWTEFFNCDRNADQQQIRDTCQTLLEQDIQNEQNANQSERSCHACFLDCRRHVEPVERHQKQTNDRKPIAQKSEEIFPELKSDGSSCLHG